MNPRPLPPAVLRMAHAPQMGDGSDNVVESPTVTAPNDVARGYAQFDPATGLWGEYFTVTDSRGAAVCLPPSAPFNFRYSSSSVVPAKTNADNLRAATVPTPTGVWKADSEFPSQPFDALRSNTLKGRLGGKNNIFVFQVDGATGWLFREPRLLGGHTDLWVLYPGYASPGPLKSHTRVTRFGPQGVLANTVTSLDNALKLLAPALGGRYFEAPLIWNS